MSQQLLIQNGTSRLIQPGFSHPSNSLDSPNGSKGSKGSKGSRGSRDSTSSRDSLGSGRTSLTSKYRQIFMTQKKQQKVQAIDNKTLANVHGTDCPRHAHTDMQLRLTLPFSLYTIADLHMEYNTKKLFQQFLKDIPVTEVLVIAGDLGNPCKPYFSRFLRACADRSKLVIFVPGNHEYWRMNMQDLESVCNSVGVVMLLNGTVTYKGITFVGTTLWTSLQTLEKKNLSDVELNSMNDMRFVPQLTREKWLHWHTKAYKFIQQSLAKYSHCIVITHHSPTYKSIRQRHKTLPICGCYASHCDKLFDCKSLMAWTHGHTHFTQRYRMGKSNALLINNSCRNANDRRDICLHNADQGMMSQHLACDLNFRLVSHAIHSSQSSRSSRQLNPFKGKSPTKCSTTHKSLDASLWQDDLNQSVTFPAHKVGA